LLSPAILASKTNQLNNGGRDLIITKIIINDKNALNEFVLIFLFSVSSGFIPEYSILIRCKPIKPKNNGNIKLIDPGKKEVKLILKNEPNDTSIILIKNNKIPVYK
jgi:hypothetical protein